jgi:hypothetical protein
MTTPERLPAPRPRRQILDEETADRFEPEREEAGVEDAWVKDFIRRLAQTIRSIGGKK